MPVTPSEVGEMGDSASVAQSGIGQRDVRLTPLQNAQIAATVANGGVPMTPYTVAQIQGQDLSTVDTTQPDRLARAFSQSTADTLTQLMIGSENNGTGQGRIPGVQFASRPAPPSGARSPRPTRRTRGTTPSGPCPTPRSRCR